MLMLHYKYYLCQVLGDSSSPVGIWNLSVL